MKLSEDNIQIWLIQNKKMMSDDDMNIIYNKIGLIIYEE
jgi:hypothetical protein